MTGPGFKKNFLNLFTGSVLAQLLSLALMPVISRIYGEADFGDYALYVAISSIAGILVNLRLDLAIVIAKDKREAEDLTWMAIFSSLLIGSLLGSIYFGFKGVTIFTICTALSTIAIGGIQTLVNWHSRQQTYGILARRYTGEKLITLLLTIALGYLGFSMYGLIVGLTVALVLAFLYLFLMSKLSKPSFSYDRWKNTLLNFSDFPSKNIISTVFQSLAFHLPAFLFVAYFTKSDLGQFDFARRLIENPIILIGNTFSTVYYQHSASLAPSARLPLYRRSLRMLTFIFLPAFLFVGIWGQEMFGFLFGSNWQEAGRFAQWLAPMTLLKLFFVSQNPLLFVERKLLLNLAMAALLFTSQIGGFFTGLMWGANVISCVMFMCIFGFLTYLLGLILVHRSLRNEPI